jgi:hypothetical protein
MRHGPMSSYGISNRKEIRKRRVKIKRAARVTG